MAGAAHAAFRDQPPSSVRLVDVAERPTWERLRLSLVAQAPEQEEAFSPPPLLSAPGGEAQPAPKDAPPPLVQPERPPGQSPNALDIPVDPYAGTFVGKEVMVGALMVFAVDLITTIGVVGVALVAFSSGDPVTGTVATIAAVLVGFVFNLVVSPLAAALGAYWMADKEGNNGLFGALLGAYAAQAIITVVSVGASFGVSLLTAGLSQGGTINPAASFVSLAVSVVFLALHWVGMPMAASLGIHWGGAVDATDAEPLVARERRRAKELPVRPHEWLEQVMFPQAAPVMTVTF